MRREPLAAVLLCVVGGFLVLVAAGRAWVRVDVAGSPLLPPRTVDVLGSDLLPGLSALGIAGLAGVLAVAASRGRGRAVVGAVLLAVSLAVLVLVAQAALGEPGLTASALESDPVVEAGGADGASTGLTPWPLVAVLGAVLLDVAGVLVLVRGPGWSALGRRYDAPSAPAPGAGPEAAGPAAERDLWAALDRGEDPTAGESPRAADPGAR